MAGIGKVLTTIGVGIGILSTILTFIMIIYGQGKAKAREEERMKNLSKIDTQLNNHITELKADVKEVSVKVSEIGEIQTRCRIEMEGRVSKMEGKSINRRNGNE